MAERATTHAGGAATPAGILAGFFGVIGRPQSYLNLVYLSLMFPLGVFYFVFLVTGLSVGLATTLIWIGFPVLLLVGGAWYLLAGFERWLAGLLLRGVYGRNRGPARAGATGELQGFAATPALSEAATPASAVPTAPAAPPPSGRARLWARLKAYLLDTGTWTSLVYLLSKFPLGVISFTVLVSAVAVVGACLAAPWALAFTSFEWGPWRLDGPLEAWLVFALGLAILLPAALHLLNMLAWAWGWWADQLLGARDSRYAVRAT